MTGCSAALKNDLPPASTERLDLSVDISAACEKLDKEVPHPVIRPGDDSDTIILTYAAALEVANATIGADRECKQDLRARYKAAQLAGKEKQ
ncbi:MAG: hypothetical protein E6G97_07425 [Alphaproteobacteria bacterium]|nr:MAG: hypothetical protein E6G97_07425 [Alphaproteobacteria bacterium]